jgi:hypothetical protein
MLVKRFKQNRQFLKEYAHLSNKELNIVLTCIGTPYINITHISASTGFWIYVDSVCFAHLRECYTPLKFVKSVTFFLYLVHNSY